MKTIFALLGLIFLTTLSNSIFGQKEGLEQISNSSIKKNSALLQVGVAKISSGWLQFNTTTVSVSFSREVSWKYKPQGFRLLVGANFGGRMFGYVREAYENYYFFTPKLNMLFGKTNRAFEVELGVMLLLNYPKVLRDGGHTYTRNTEFANVKLGYRYQPKEGGLLFRIGLGYPTGLYTGFGYVF